MEPRIQPAQADEIVDDESNDGDDQFNTALDAVVTEVKPEYTLVEAQSRTVVASPKKDQPFKFPKPLPTKPPAGLKHKQPPGEAKRKAKLAPAKKAAPAKKKAGKKPAKQTKPKKAVKTTKGKTQEAKKAEQANEDKTVEEFKENKLEVIRVDSETGEQFPEAMDTTGFSPDISRRTSPRLSSKASDELNESKNTDSLEGTLAVPEVPRFVPKPPEPQVSPSPEAQIDRHPELELVQPSPAEEQKPPQESKAARRAAERAAAAERRRQEVERKRREREEAKRKALEEEARLEKVRLEAEEDMKRREEQRRYDSF